MSSVIFNHTGRRLTVILAGVLTLLLRGELFAAGTEVVAPWEGETEARLWGSALVKETLAGESMGLRLNAACDTATIEEISALKDHCRAALQAGQAAAPASRAWASALLRLGSISLSPLDLNDRTLALSAYTIIDDLYAFPIDSLGKNSRQPDGSWRFLPPVVASGTGRGVSSTAGDLVIRHLSEGWGHLESVVGQVSPATASDIVDFFRVFSYLWEDIPAGIALVSPAPAGEHPFFLLDLITALQVPFTSTSATHFLENGHSEHPVCLNRWKVCYPGLVAAWSSSTRWMIAYGDSLKHCGTMPWFVRYTFIIA